ncbi:hypothetical protein DFQ27_003102 [Actinomortierella ambigua]|uniref:Uncharacterized protein n=1 Tax=Actinomortierella ambigua TaxID=1343610 RepID=A0A9P6U6G6_9FUNG|nr:hypothetical protein DFQ27_003102 [Actinomortierella ambigua]
MLVFDSLDMPYVTRFNPSVAINATHSTKPDWWNAVISVNYRWDFKTSNIFSVPQPNNQSAVYHAFIEDGRTVGFGYLNTETKQMEACPTKWDLIPRPNKSFTSIHYGINTIYAIYTEGVEIGVLSLEANLTNGVNIHPMSGNSSWTPWSTAYSTCYNYIASSFGEILVLNCRDSPSTLNFVGRSTHQIYDSTTMPVDQLGVAIPGQFGNVSGVHLPDFAFIQDYNNGVYDRLHRLSSMAVDAGTLWTMYGNNALQVEGNYGADVYPIGSRDGQYDGGYKVILEVHELTLASIFINVLALIVLCGFKCFRRRYTWNDAQHVKVQNVGTDDSDEVEDGDNKDAKDGGGDGSQVDEEAAAEISQKQPENDDDPQVIVVEGKLTDDDNHEGREEGKSYIENGEKEENSGAEEISHVGNRRGAMKKQGSSRTWSGEAVPMTIIIGAAAAPAVATAALQPSLGDQPASGPSSRPESKKSGPSGTTVRQQRIVLSNHPRPTIVTMIDEGSTHDGEGANEDDDDEEPTEEWVPKPFDPQAHRSQSHPPPQPQPQPQPQPSSPARLSPHSPTTNTTFAEPSAPPAPSHIDPDMAREGVAVTTSPLDPEADDDIDGEEPPPMYEPRPTDSKLPPQPPSPL